MFTVIKRMEISAAHKLILFMVTTGLSLSTAVLSGSMQMEW